MFPDGLPRYGMSTVAALSEELVHQNHRPTGSWSQAYRHGINDDELRAIEPCDAPGTTVTFRARLDGPADLVDADLDGFRWLAITRTWSSGDGGDAAP